MKRKTEAAAVLGLPLPELVDVASPGGSSARVRAQKRHSGLPPVSAPVAAAPFTSSKAAKKQKLMNSVQLPARVITPADKSALAFSADWHDRAP
jgi:hypothetical protein